MKRFALCIGGLLLLTGQQCDVPVEITDDSGSGSGYRKVTLTGTVHTDCNEASVALSGGQGLKAFEYTGNYTMELWFPMAGGEAVQQRNTMVLTAYQEVCFGSAVCNCSLTPAPSAYEERTFELEATLTLNGIYENDLPADELSIHLADLPIDPITVTAVCGTGAPGDYSDPSTYSSLMMYFYMNTLVSPIRVDDHVTNTWEGYPLSHYDDMYFVDITETRDYTIVSSLD